MRSPLRRWFAEYPFTVVWFISICWITFVIAVTAGGR
jgi:hypothetical protein